MNSVRSSSLAMLLLLLPLFAVSGCTEITPLIVPKHRLVMPHTFSHADLDRVLQRFVDHQGRVNYAALKNEASDLEQYYLLLTTYSPDSHPALFPTEHSKLAYWLNAYNAAVLKTVLTYYPISSVEDIKPPFPFFFLPRKSGFFLFQRVTFGGRTTSLYVLEHRVIRKRFADPRVHFALNCASGGCPRLPQQAFSAEHLDAQLDQAARQFLAERRNFTIDHDKKTVSLSSIFDWYTQDFLSWYQHRFPAQSATLINYVCVYLGAESVEELRGRAAAYQVHFFAYDWRLNDQSGRASSGT